MAFFYVLSLGLSGNCYFVPYILFYIYYLQCREVRVLLCNCTPLFLGSDVAMGHMCVGYQV